MSSPKGYPSGSKLNRVSQNFATVESVRLDQFGLSVLAHQYVELIGTDAVDSATTSVITAASHAAQKGDIIRFTSGTYSGREVKVDSTATNTITLAEDLASAPSASDGFQILRHRYPRVNSSGESMVTGSFTANTSFQLDGVDQIVTEDTGTPANTKPLPVKVFASNGSLIDFATSADQVTGNTYLNSIDGKIVACNTGNVTVGSSALPTGAATSAKQDTGNTSLASIDGKITACNTGAVTVTSSALPTGAATEATLSAASAKLPATLGQKTAANSMAVVLPSDQIVSVNPNLDVIDFIDTTPVLDTSSTNITASSGNPVQVVATLAANVKRIRVNDTTGEFIGVYTGAALSETLQCVIGPGLDGDIDVQMSSGERVSLRNMANSAISTGKLCIQFYG